MIGARKAIRLGAGTLAEGIGGGLSSASIAALGEVNSSSDGAGDRHCACTAVSMAEKPNFMVEEFGVTVEVLVQTCWDTSRIPTHTTGKTNRSRTAVTTRRSMTRFAPSLRRVANPSETQNAPQGARFTRFRPAVSRSWRRS